VVGATLARGVSRVQALCHPIPTQRDSTLVNLRRALYDTPTVEDHLRWMTGSPGTGNARLQRDRTALQPGDNELGARPLTPEA
jgi:hypothetical protein